MTELMYILDYLLIGALYTGALLYCRWTMAKYRGCLFITVIVFFGVLFWPITCAFALIRLWRNDIV